MLDVLERSPRRYCDRVRRTDHSVNVVDSGTALVIEGYPGSGNSFAREAFLLANPGVPVASHLHSTAHVARAAELGVPAMVLLREPESACVSWVLRYPDVTIAHAVQRYVHFHRRLWAIRHHPVLVPFEMVTSEFGEAIALVNARYGTTFAQFEQTTANSEAIFGHLEDAARQWFGTEGHAARPSAARDANKGERTAELRAYRGGRPLADAFRWYERLRGELPAAARERSGA
jgi:hypothetical protein